MPHTYIFRIALALIVALCGFRLSIDSCSFRLEPEAPSFNSCSFRLQPEERLQAAEQNGQVIDRILATVGGTLVLQSDAVAMMRLGEIQVPDGRNPLQWAMDRLIERRLMLIEVDRYGPPEPDRAEIDRRMQALDERIGSGDRLDAILRETGLTVEQLRLHVRDELRIQAYIQQRFGATFQPTEDAILDYYRTHPEQFTRDGKLRPFGDAREEARRAVLAQLRDNAVREWLADLRRRTEVQVLYLPGR